VNRNDAMKSLWEKFSQGNNPRKVLAGSLVLLLVEGLVAASLIYDWDQPGPRLSSATGVAEVPTLGEESDQLPEYPGEVFGRHQPLPEPCEGNTLANHNFDFNAASLPVDRTDGLSSLVMQPIRNEDMSRPKDFSVGEYEVVVDSGKALVSLQKPYDILAVRSNGSQGLECSNQYRFDLDFRFDRADGAEENRFEDFCRILATTNGGWRDSIGFSLLICEAQGLTLWTSDGTYLIEGYQRNLTSLSSGWNALSVDFRFALDSPTVIFSLNGKKTSVRLVEWDRANPEIIRHNFADPDFTLYLGGHPEDLYQNVGGDDDSQLSLDIARLDIRTGNLEQDSTRLSAILEQFIDGSVGAADQEALVREFEAKFEYQWEGIGPTVLRFLDFVSTRSPIYQINGENPPIEALPAIDRLQFLLKQWIVDDLSAATTGPLRFAEAELFPGFVSDDVPRQTAEIAIDGTYATDSQYRLAGQHQVLRPTGRYLAPGEIATVTVPESALGKGWFIQVGIHDADLEIIRESQGWNRFPRITRKFAVDRAQFEIDNPFGGPIYMRIPDGSAIGETTVMIDGAVEMPTYSTARTENEENNLGKFNTANETKAVPWFEILGEKFILTYPVGMAHLFTDPEPIMGAMDSSIGAINVMAGRPAERFRKEWLTLDSTIASVNPFPVSYPWFGALDEVVGEVRTVKDFVQDDGAWSPIDLASKSVSNLKGGTHIVWHEIGHAHNLPTAGFEAGVCNEGESNVHLLATVIYNQILNADMDTALRLSGFQDYGFRESALDTMFSPSWQSNERMCVDAWDNEMQYQTRSWARIAEIADLYGWEVVGEIHRVFYQIGTASMKDQDTILWGSRRANVNLAPIFDFWGVPPTTATRVRLAGLPPATEFIERLEFYREAIPETRAEYESVIRKLRATTGKVDRWDHYLENYDPELSETMKQRIDEIITSIQ
jgi:hypothetical protein